MLVDGIGTLPIVETRYRRGEEKVTLFISGNDPGWEYGFSPHGSPFDLEQCGLKSAFHFVGSKRGARYNGLGRRAD